MPNSAVYVNNNLTVFFFKNIFENAFHCLKLVYIKLNFNISLPKQTFFYQNCNQFRFYEVL